VRVLTDDSGSKDRKGAERGEMKIAMSFVDAWKQWIYGGPPAHILTVSAMGTHSESEEEACACLEPMSRGGWEKEGK
jgi:hypothetical protein